MQMLSPREIEVMQCAVKGLTAKDTAKHIGLTESAINLYLMRARYKLGAKNKAEAVAKFAPPLNGDEGEELLALREENQRLRQQLEHIRRMIGITLEGGTAQ